MLKLFFVCDSCGKAADVKSRDLPLGWARLAQNIDACSGSCFDALQGKPMPVAPAPSASDESTLPVGKSKDAAPEASAPMPVVAAAPSPVVPSKAAK